MSDPYNTAEDWNEATSYDPHNEFDANRFLAETAQEEQEAAEESALDRYQRIIENGTDADEIMEYVLDQAEQARATYPNAYATGYLASALARANSERS